MFSIRLLQEEQGTLLLLLRSEARSWIRIICSDQLELRTRQAVSHMERSQFNQATTKKFSQQANTNSPSKLLNQFRKNASSN